MAEFQVIGAGGTEMPPCVALRPGRRGWSRPVYLFQAPDGVGRMALEHRLLRPADGYIAAVFATSLAPARLGGLAGVILRSSSDGAEQTTVVGPPGTCKTLLALRHFVRWRHPRVVGVDVQAAAMADTVYEDAHIRAWAVTTAGTAGRPCADADRGETGTRPKRAKANDGSSAVGPAGLGGGAETRHPGGGRVDTLGSVPPQLASDANPLFFRHATTGALAPVTADATPHATGERLLAVVCECLQTDLTVVLLDCAAEGDLRHLGAVERVTREVGAYPRVAIIHTCGPQLFRSREYTRWIKGRSAPHVRHIDLTGAATTPAQGADPDVDPAAAGLAPCADHPSGYFAHRATAKQRWRLHQAAPAFYPVCACFRRLGSQPLGDAELVFDADGVAAPPLLAVLAPSKTGRGFTIGLDASVELVQGLGASLDLEGMSSPAADPQAGVNQAPLPEAWRLHMIGTGCAEPSKYRASSGIYLHLAGHAGQGRDPCGLLLDAGDGLVPQMVQLSGHGKAMAMIGRLACVWISHKHADHCAGLLQVICLHRQMRPASAQPLLVIGPNSVGFWVRESLLAMGYRLEEVCFFVHFSVFDGDGAGGAQPAVVERKHDLLRRAGLLSLRSVPVVHCADASALVLEGLAPNAAEGGLRRPPDDISAPPGGNRRWKIVYSGDTRPTDELAEAAKGATLLIHEGTFDAKQQDKAERKRHSTIPEALAVGEDAGAWRVLLTHFSQRYPNVPPHDRKEHSGPRSAIAFDGLVVSSGSLGAIPDMMPAVMAATSAGATRAKAADPGPSVSAQRRRAKNVAKPAQDAFTAPPLDTGAGHDTASATLDCPSFPLPPAHLMQKLREARWTANSLPAQTGGGGGGGGAGGGDGGGERRVDGAKRKNQIIYFDD